MAGTAEAGGGCGWPGGQSEASSHVLGAKRGGKLNGTESRPESQDSEGEGHTLPPGSGVGEKGLHSTLCEASGSS